MLALYVAETNAHGASKTPVAAESVKSWHPFVTQQDLGMSLRLI